MLSPSQARLGDWEVDVTGITNPAEAFFKDGIWGFDGTVWRKLPLVWGYSDRYAQLASNTNLPAGTSDVDGSTVPSSEVWVVTGMCITVASATITQIRFAFYNGSDRVDVHAIDDPVNVFPNGWAGQLILKTGDCARARVYTATAGDDCWLNVWGYKMKVAQ